MKDSLTTSKDRALQALQPFPAQMQLALGEHTSIKGKS
jgi:hypothetical protein